jgi:hypothetical protein
MMTLQDIRDVSVERKTNRLESPRAISSNSPDQHQTDNEQDRQKHLCTVHCLGIEVEAPCWYFHVCASRYVGTESSCTECMM